MATAAHSFSSLCAVPPISHAWQLVPLVYELLFAIQVLMVSFTLKGTTSSSERIASGLQMATSSISLFNELSSHPFAMKQVQ